jgi:hypothetical protein
VLELKLLTAVIDGERRIERLALDIDGPLPLPLKYRKGGAGALDMAAVMQRLEDHTGEPARVLQRLGALDAAILLALLFQPPPAGKSKR